MPTLRTFLPLAAVAAVLLTGCAAPAAVSEPVPGAGTRVVATAQGEVTVPAEPRRTVVLNSALAGYLYALDVPVAATIGLRPDATTFPDFWADEAAAQRTVRLPWSSDGFDLEAIVAQAPDLIIGGGQGFPGAQGVEAYARLREIAPTVLVDTALATWQQQLAFLAGAVLDVPAAEQRLLDAYATRVAEVRAAITPPPGPTSYILMLRDGVPWSIPETAALPATLAEVGIVPAAVIADNPRFETFGTGDSFEVSEELAGETYTGPSAFVLGFQADVTSVADLAADPIYAGLPAFTSGRAFDLPWWAHRADWFATMALLDEVERLFGRA